MADQNEKKQQQSQSSIAPKIHPLLAQNLNIFNLSSEILNALKSHQANMEPQIDKEVQSGIANTDVSGSACSACGEIRFETAEEYREHFQTDWHRFNLRRKVSKSVVKPVSEEEFEEMLAELTDSSSDTDSEKPNISIQTSYDAVTALFEKHQFVHDTKEIEKENLQHYDSPYLWFSAQPFLPVEIHLGIYKQIFPDYRHGNSVEFLKNAQIKDSNAGTKRIWTMIMLSGGYFAGLVCSLNPYRTGKDAGMEPIVHKRFQRYTVRKKQGGAQSAHDNAKSGAKSAGADLRRFNEAKLQQEIRDLLATWKKWIEISECIFVYAPSANKKIIYGYEGAVMKKADSRIRSFPFSTKRPTLKELKRSFAKLTTLKIFEVSTESLKQIPLVQDPAEALARKVEVAAKTTGLSKAKTVKQDPIQETDLNGVKKLIDLIRKGKLDLLITHMQKFSISPKLTLEDEEFKATPTFLHLASFAGQPEIVSYFLTLNLDPTVISAQNKTPYDIAQNKETRNAFRRYMAEQMEKWDWSAAHVPSPLTKELEEEQERKAKEKEKKKKDKERKKKIIKEDDHMKKDKDEGNIAETSTIPKQTFIAQSISQVITDTNLTPEMKIRIEREKRARAAEVRFAKLTNRGNSESVLISNTKNSNHDINVGLVCEECNASLAGKVPFERMQWRYCSTQCVAKHRASVG
ncbi:hypothetical protein G9A89_010014 [Geosiphon pyriformis]|nr:hypothetical protein G9A89_010014 [Geosiphon pyriformis]